MHAYCICTQIQKAMKPFKLSESNFGGIKEFGVDENRVMIVINAALQRCLKLIRATASIRGNMVYHTRQTQVGSTNFCIPCALQDWY